MLEQIHERTGYRTDVLEKDYYVVLMLHELAEKQKAGLPAYFKGGTALYKALKTTNRFSEDIDLSVDTRGCSRSQNDRRLEQAAKKYAALDRDASSGRTNRSEVISIFTYEPITAYDASDALQRFGKLKIEATSFTISEPTASLEIAPMLYDLASETEQKILREQYDVAPFSVMTITTERISIDKLFAAEAYVRRSAEPQRAFEAAKHIYDLAVMIRQPNIQSLLTNDVMVKKLLDIRVEEEAGRLDGIPGVMPQEFTFFDTAAGNDEVRKAYAVMQAQYVLRPEDRIEYDAAMAALGEIRDRLMRSRAWTLYAPGEELLRHIRQQEEERLRPAPSQCRKRDDMER
ncbi:MAG: nucleotidyl transferase AbiEii/AbiGii toxin family protein [Lachnospiraceae bacterium]|nr:nucleotidyl transferase AbiEii/AbiGii toxin family protein [Lachnospiraceae bacterium]